MPCTVILTHTKTALWKLSNRVWAEIECVFSESWGVGVSRKLPGVKTAAVFSWVFVLTLWRTTFVLHWSSLPFVLSIFPSPSLLSLFLCGIWFFHFMWFIPPYPFLGLPHLFLCCSPSLSLSLAVGSDLKDIQNNKHRYLVASENQRPGHFSTAPIGSLTASPSSGSLCSQGGLQSVSSIQERIMSTPGGEEAIERLKVN